MDVMAAGTSARQYQIYQGHMGIFTCLTLYMISRLICISQGILPDSSTILAVQIVSFKDSAGWAQNV